MAAKVLDDEELFLENEFSSLADFLKDFLRKKFANYRSEMRKLQVEICSLNKQLVSNKAIKNRLQREKQLLLSRCVHYEEQIAILAVNKKDEKQEMLDKAQTLAVELNTVITHLKTPEKNEQTNKSISENQPCDSSTNTTDESGQRLVPDPIQQVQIEKQISDLMDTDSDDDSESDSDSDVMILEAADDKPHVCPRNKPPKSNPGSSLELPSAFPPYPRKLLHQKITDTPIPRKGQCGKDLATNTALSVAICNTKASINGTEKKAYLCTTNRCGRRFHQKSSLAYHQRTSHRPTNKLNAQRKRGPKEKNVM